MTTLERTATLRFSVPQEMVGTNSGLAYQIVDGLSVLGIEARVVEDTVIVLSGRLEVIKNFASLTYEVEWEGPASLLMTPDPEALMRLPHLNMRLDVSTVELHRDMGYRSPSLGPVGRIDAPARTYANALKALGSAARRATCKLNEAATAMQAVYHKVKDDLDTSKPRRVGRVRFRRRG